MALASEFVATVGPQGAEPFLGIYLFAPVGPVSDARNELTLPLDLPPGAIVGHAAVEFAARPAGRTAIGKVARVRPASSDVVDLPATAHVVDFGGLRTVSSLTVPGGVSSVTPWLGTQFAARALAHSLGGPDEVRFTEVRTERLLVDTATSREAVAVAADGLVTINDAPADLEVVVGGERATILPGPVRAESAVFSDTLDITALVQGAVDAGRSPVEVVLRSSVPAQLELVPALIYLHAHRVQLPEGERRTLALVGEGVVDVALPLGAESTGWAVKLVRFELAAAIGEERVVPATGPELGSDAELVCDPDRPLAVRLPPSAVRRFAEVRGIRLPVRADEDAELAGFLTGEVAGPAVTGGLQPGDPLKGGDLAPTVVAAADGLRWVTLPLSRPWPLDPGDAVWAVVQATRGSVRVALAAAAGAPDDAALVRRQASNGSYRPLPAVTGVATAAIGLRVVGAAPPTGPVDAVVVRVPGAPGSAEAPGPAVVSSVAATPGPDATVHELRYGSAVAAGSPARPGTDLLLRFEVSAPGDYTLGPVTVGYEEAP